MSSVVRQYCSCTPLRAYGCSTVTLRTMLVYNHTNVGLRKHAAAPTACSRCQCEPHTARTKMIHRARITADVATTLGRLATLAASGWPHSRLRRRPASPVSAARQSRRIDCLICAPDKHSRVSAAPRAVSLSRRATPSVACSYVVSSAAVLQLYATTRLRMLYCHVTNDARLQSH
jgi:hypothetical protein